jgi:hypothetical protein
MHRRFAPQALPVLILSVFALAGQGVAEDLRMRSPSVPAQGLRSALSSTSRCTIRHDDSGWWLVAPDGKPFFSLGVCVFHQGTHSEEYDPARPSYAALRHYQSADDWAAASLGRLKQWGFTTVGGWGDYATVRFAGDNQWWLTPVLHLGSSSGAPWFDMWDEKIVRRVEDVAANVITPLSGDPRVIGYYSDNELGWWNGVLWKMTLEHPASSGQRQRLVRLVREVYANSWDALVRDFQPQDAASWEELQRGGMLWLRPGTGGIHTVRRFLSMAADRYYQLMRDTIRKFDSEALYLGDRYQSFYYPEVAAASRPYVDVVSTNLNASWNDGTFIHAYLDTLHRLSGKPVIASEFYMAASENRSGNKNSVGGFPKVQNQEQRAQALVNTLRELLRRPYVIGADWFQYFDEPPHGRKLDGEDYNFGLVDIHDRPYEAVTEAFAKLNIKELKSGAAPSHPNATRGVPPAPADPMHEFQYMLALKQWDRRRGFVPPVSQHPVGDLYICWSPDALYLATFVIDIVDPDYYRDQEIPEIDRAMWIVRVAGLEPIQARIGAGKAPVMSGPGIRIKSLSGVYHDVRCITSLELPASLFGKSAFQVGDEIALDTDYTTHARAYRMEWKGNFVLSD